MPRSRPFKRTSHGPVHPEDSPGASPRPDGALLEPAAPSVTAILAGLALLAAAWAAAGSLGLMVPALRHGLGWLLMGVALIAAWPRRKLPWSDLGLLLGAVAVAIAGTATELTLYNLLAVAILGSMLAWLAEGADRRVLMAAGFACLALTLYRLAYESIPAAWLAADALAGSLGSLAGGLTGNPLWLGPSFAGLDLLVLMLALGGAWAVQSPAPRLARVVLVVAAIGLVHTLYLLVLASSDRIAAWLPLAPSPPEPEFPEPAAWYWADGVRRLLPWNLPLLAGVLHLAVAGAVWRWWAWPSLTPAPGAKSPEAAPASSAGRMAMAAVLLVLALPLLTVWSGAPLDLGGRKIVLCDRGYLDWQTPQHGRYGHASAGMYGMLPELAKGLGAEVAHSRDLAAEDLAGADALVVIHPLEPWPEEQYQRVWEFVRAGGGLLLVAGLRTENDHTPTATNRILEPLGMEVGFDTAISATRLWQHNVSPLAHATTTGLESRPCGFGLTVGPTIRTTWPAAPVLVGPWAWGEPGSEPVFNPDARWDPAERLGDCVLAAQQRVGQGKVLVLSDHTSLSNEALPYSYPFVGRALATLVSPGGGNQDRWRQLLGVLAAAAAIVLLARVADPGWLLGAAGGLAMALLVARGMATDSWQILPQGPTKEGRPIACIDGSHAEAFVDDRWSADGIAGLSLNLMRNGYLPLVIDRFDSPLMDRASLLVSIAPVRRFSSAERQRLLQFVDRGGLWICTVGGDQAGAVNPLLADFDMYVPQLPVAVGDDASEPVPHGSIRAQYVADGKSKAEVILYAGWPVESPKGGASFLVHGQRGEPVMAARRLGRGTAILIGDTAFALNKNLESTEGELTYEGSRNVDFWRWLLGEFGGRPAWTPPDPVRTQGESKEDDR